MIYLLLIAHFVGDFICQSDWMAINKSKRWDALAVHVIVYITVLAVFIVALAPSGEGYYAFCFVNLAAHFVQDAITSRINARLWFIKFLGKSPQYVMFNEANKEVPVWDCQLEERKRHWFFISIGFDQLLHYITLFITADLWLVT